MKQAVLAGWVLSLAVFAGCEGAAPVPPTAVGPWISLSDQPDASYDPSGCSAQFADGCSWGEVRSLEVKDFLFESSDSVLLVTGNIYRLSLATGLGEIVNFRVNGLRPVPGGEGIPHAIEFGPDGGIWVKYVSQPRIVWTEKQNVRVATDAELTAADGGRIGQATAFTTADMQAFPDGRLVFGEVGNQSVGLGHFTVFDPTTREMKTFPIPRSSNLDLLGFGLDGAGGIWVSYADKTFRVDTATGAVQEHALRLERLPFGPIPGGGAWIQVADSAGKNVLAKLKPDGTVEDFLSFKDDQGNNQITGPTRVRKHAGHLYLSADNGFWRTREPVP